MLTQCAKLDGHYLFDRMLERLHVSLDAYGRIDWSVFDVDRSNVRAEEDSNLRPAV